MIDYNSPAPQTSSQQGSSLPIVAPFMPEAHISPRYPKAREMAKCLSDIQETLNNRTRKELNRKGVPFKNISCNSSQYYADPSIWFQRYPTKGSCYDNRRLLPPSASGLSIDTHTHKPKDSQKNEMLKACQNHLKQVKLGKNPPPPLFPKDGWDPPTLPGRSPIMRKKSPPQVEKMAKCLSDTQKALNNIEKRKLRAKGSKPSHILCANECFPADLQVWGPKNITGYCFDTKTKLSSGSFPIYHKINPERSNYSEKAKYRILKDCLTKLYMMENMMENKMDLPLPPTGGGEQTLNGGQR